MSRPIDLSAVFDDVNAAEYLARACAGDDAPPHIKDAALKALARLLSRTYEEIENTEEAPP